jgi:hypothetical protein
VPQPADIAHLLRRAGFGGTAAQIATLASQNWSTTVDQLLDFSTAPADTEPAFLTADIGDWEKEYQLQHWWLNRMATTTTPLQEKLTFFWHGHFAAHVLADRDDGRDALREGLLVGVGGRGSVPVRRREVVRLDGRTAHVLAHRCNGGDTDGQGLLARHRGRGRVLLR